MSNMEIELPDFEKMFALLNQIKDSNLKKQLLEIEIKEEQSKITSKVTTDESYFINKKPPSIAYIDRTYLFSGLDGKLIDKRKELAQVIADLDHARLTFDLNSKLIDVWRTEMANQRRAVE